MAKGKSYILFVTLIIPLFCFSAQAPKRKAQWEKEKRELLKKIKQAQKILAETESKKKASIGQLNAINTQIEANELFIQSINHEINALDKEISQIYSSVTALEGDLAQLKKEYAVMIYAGSKAINHINKLIFIFSSTSFNQLLQRLRYLKHYTKVRKRQFDEIAKVKALLKGQQVAAEEKRKEKQALLQQQNQEKNQLVALKQKQAHTIATLNKKRDELCKELATRNAAVKRLNKLITDVVQEEVKKGGSVQKPSSKSTNVVTLTPTAKALSTNFDENRGKLPWPVNAGFVSGKFGTRVHSVLSKVMVENLGIDIQSNKGEVARAVFEGTIKAVVFVPGMRKVVIIQHGEYHTVYAKLQSTSVKVGQHVKAKDPIGTLYTDKNGITELQFQLWKNNQKLNPELWLMKK